MTDKTKMDFDESKSYGLAKHRLISSTIFIVVIIGSMIFDKDPTPPICFGLIAMLAIYLFLPFTYKLIVSDEAISSINLFGTRTLEWGEVAEIGFKNGNLFLSNRDGDIKVTVNNQINDYPNVIKFIKQQRPELWHLDDINSFHQDYVQSVFSSLIGLGTLIAGFVMLFNDDLTTDIVIPMLLIFGTSAAFILSGLLRIRKLSLDGDILVVQYLFWKRQIHVKEVWSVNLEQNYEKNVVTYPVHIRVSDQKDIVIEKTKEGNPLLVNAIEKWMQKYKGK
jgi:hypothetical protein